MLILKSDLDVIDVKFDMAYYSVRVTTRHTTNEYEKIFWRRYQQGGWTLALRSRYKAVVNGRHPAALSKLLRQPKES